MNNLCDFDYSPIYQMDYYYPSVIWIMILEKENYTLVFEDQLESVTYIGDYMLNFFFSIYHVTQLISTFFILI